LLRRLIGVAGIAFSRIFRTWWYAFLVRVHWYFAAAEEGTFKQAAIAYDGPAFKGLDAASLSSDASAYLQENLRIISAVYGLARPYDLIQPYRLCMGDKLAIGGHRDLYDFWKDVGLAENLFGDMGKSEEKLLVVNVSSHSG
jgi:cytoplasmic iron level regulating protein YaaA (DUF328/UPF0246 family)